MSTVPFRTEADVRASLGAVCAHLAAGGLLAYPTETVYGLGSEVTEDATAALAALKGRAAGKPFLVLVAARTMAESLGLMFNRAASALAEAFWPGPLTLVLPGGQGTVPDRLRGPEGGVAVRWTSHLGVAQLIEAFGAPITSTSANRPGQSTAPGVEALVATFGSAVKSGQLLVLDGGTLGSPPSSTVVDCTRDTPRMVRDGAIPRAELSAKVGSLAP